MRSLRSLAVAHQLGHVLRGERDQSISLLERLLAHAETTARYSIYYGKGRDAFDVRGRTAHESIFNLNDGSYRCPNSQQGYSPFSTWTRGLAWAILGYAEQLEFLGTLNGKADRAGDPRAERGASQPVAVRPRYGGNPGPVPRGRPRDGGLLPRQLLRGRHPDVGHGRAAIASPGRLPREACRPVQPLGAGGQLGRRHRGAGPGSPGELSFRPEATRRTATAIARPGLTVANTLFDEPYLSTESQTPGLAAALGLSSAQRLGLRRARPEGAERREFDVGRLPRPRTGAAAACAKPAAKSIPPSSPRAPDLSVPPQFHGLAFIGRTQCRARPSRRPRARARKPEEPRTRTTTRTSRRRSASVSRVFRYSGSLATGCGWRVRTESAV